MKNGRLQAKDIPDEPVLAFLRGPFDGWPVPGSATWFWSHDYQPANSVVRAMPPGTPAKLALAKMRSMIARGLVEGCACGCRGDFALPATEWSNDGTCVEPQAGL